MRGVSELAYVYIGIRPLCCWTCEVATDENPSVSFIVFAFLMLLIMILCFSWFDMFLVFLMFLMRIMFLMWVSRARQFLMVLICCVHAYRVSYVSTYFSSLLRCGCCIWLWHTSSAVWAVIKFILKIRWMCALGSQWYSRPCFHFAQWRGVKTLAKFVSQGFIATWSAMSELQAVETTAARTAATTAELQQDQLRQQVQTISYES